MERHSENSKKKNIVLAYILYVIIKLIKFIICLPFLLLKGIFKITIFIIYSIVKGIKKLSDSNKKFDAEKELEKMQSDSQKIIEEFNQNKKVEYSNKHTKYDDYFTYIIRQRGNDYYQRNLVSDLKKDNDTYTAIVSGTSNYKVNFKIDNKGIRDMDCECPYFQSGEGNCKHLYASILKYQNSNFVNESNTIKAPNFSTLLELIDQMEELFDEATDLYNENDTYSELEDLYNELEDFQDNMNQYKELKLKDLNVVTIDKAKYDYDQMENIYQEMQDVLEELKEDNNHHSNYINTKDEEEKEESWQDDYEPYNYEEEDLEEDDYYFEDEE